MAPSSPSPRRCRFERSGIAAKSKTPKVQASPRGSILFSHPTTPYQTKNQKAHASSNSLPAPSAVPLPPHRPSGRTTLGVRHAGCLQLWLLVQRQQPHHQPGGVGFGALYDFPIASRVNLGLDARGNVTPSTTGGAKGFVSARAAFVPHESPLRPYFQIGVGEIHAKVPASSFTVGAQSVNKLGLDIALGLDVRLNHSFDYRVLELEGGAGFNNNHGTNAASASLSTGIVYHFTNTGVRRP